MTEPQRDRSGFTGFDWSHPALQEALRDANLSIEVELWHPSFDPLTAPCWWQWREPCDCPDTSFGRNPHRWNCPQTPIWAQLATPAHEATAGIRSATWVLEDILPEIRINRFVWDGSRDRACGRGPCCLGENHDGRCRM